MKIARFNYKGRPEYGVVENDKIRIVDGSIFDERVRLGKDCLALKDITPLAPVAPGKIICVGLNYKDHAMELKMEIPREPVLFLKPPTAVIGPGDDIIYPETVGRLDYEAELALVIKKKAKNIPVNNAYDCILGYTCLNDVTARDLQKKDTQWTRAKSFDTFCPTGPYIVSDVCPDNLKIELKVNGSIRQSSSTANLIFRVEFLVSFISGVMTLLPGDIISTGTPPGVGPVSRGDNIELSIEGIGTLKNTVR